MIGDNNKMVNNNVVWINFLHLYQPANTIEHHIREATEKSYLRIVRSIEENPDTKITLNISGCLIVRWSELGYNYLIKRIADLIKSGRIEIVGTAAYHPLMPLIDIDEAKTQIEENESILKKYFDIDRPAGFFFPEMAYSREMGRLVKRLGYDWIIVDEITMEGRIKQSDVNEQADYVYKDSHSGLMAVTRSRKDSSQFVPDFLINHLNNENAKKDLFVTATDAELYGLRHEDPTANFEKVLQNNKLITKTISEFMKGKIIKEIRLVDSNWESTEIELANGIPYALWYDPKNAIQKKIWELADYAYAIIEKNKSNKNSDWSRWHYVRGLASCTFWWASGKDFSHIYGPHAWNPDEIIKMVQELIRSVRALETTTSLRTKLKVENMGIEIMRFIWEKHWRLKHKIR